MDAKMAVFLLGYSFGAMKKVQHHLIQGELSPALSSINEELRFLKEEMEKYFYDTNEHQADSKFEQCGSCL